MDVYWMFFKLLVSTIVTFIEAAIVLFAPVAADRVPAVNVAPRLVRASARVPARPDLQSLIAQLNAADPADRTRAACALADMERAAAPAVSALAQRLGDSARVDGRVCDDDRRGRQRGDDTTTPGESAAAALASIGAPSVEALIASLRSPGWFARKNAVWALGAIEDARAVSPVIATLGDPEAPVRRNAAWALGVLEDRRAVDPLSRALLSDSDTNVRAQAAWALGVIGEPRAADALASALKDHDVEVRRHAAWALGVIQQ